MESKKLNRPNILIVAPPFLPVPATMGGAIHELIELLIRENEKYHKIDFILVSRADEKAQKLSESFHCTKFVFLHTNTSHLRYISTLSWRLRRCLHIPLPNIGTTYFVRAFKESNCFSIDHVVDDCCGYGVINKRLLKKYNNGRVFWRRIHAHSVPKVTEDGIYGNVIGVSRFVADQWKHHSKNPQLRVDVVYNAVDEDRFLKRITLEERNSLRSELGISKDDFMIIFCGRIIDLKGVCELISAVNAIEDPHVKLLIIGSPNSGAKASIRTRPYLHKVKKLTSKSNRIIFTAYIHNQELYKYYQISDIQCVPSLCEEAAGLVVLEGMWSKLPLIVTRSGGMVEYVNDECAVILEKDENLVENLTAAIIKLYNDPGLRSRMSKASTEQCKKFTKRKYYEDFCSLFIGNEDE